MLSSIPRPLVRLNQSFIFIFATSFIVSSNWLFLAVPLLAGLMGILFQFNPVIKAGKLFLKKPLSTYIPEDAEQQNFNQKIAVTLLTIALIGHISSVQWLAITSAIMVALASLVAILGFCVGCFVRFQWKQFQYRRSQHSS
ncbi:DUF4395 domain-containing protein [Pseudalkalibacillus hwajinpoensis]|uniref:DUF4395 domain-containing protein n=1 Tax=Guptibacillus hwajinpoensis TaxID=208199 RepID=A0A4U1MJV2_9BACL|nr:DUF4395 domain-containing protein [Pseudalkalibacillus hwajinpoensis]TKD71403.1 DUF4395 domain-containing protein [Pseudalkalibacillus hwajinpoensis]